MHRWRWLLPLLVALCAPSCRPGALPAATAETEVIVGHDVRIDVEAGSVRGAQVAETMEGIVEDLRHMRDSRAFAHVARDLARIVIVARERQSGGRFDHERGTLSLWPGPSGPVDRGTARRVLTEEYHDHLRRWFDHTWPEQVDPSRHADYFAYLDEVRRSPTVGASETAAALRRADEHETVSRMCQLARVAAGNRELTEEIERWLVDAIQPFAVIYRYSPDEAARMAEGSPFVQAEVALVRWLERELGNLDDELQLAALGHLFHARDPRAFRGLDRVGAGAAVVKRWLRDGAPVTETTSAQGRLFDFVVCQPRFAKGTTDVVGHGGGHCRSDTFYEFAFGSPSSIQRMADLVAAIDDPRFTEIIATHAPESFWMALEPHLAHWRVLAMHYARRAIPPQHIDEVWDRFIAGRGLTLYILATRHGRPGQGYWRTWNKRHAAPISADELGAMLDAAPRSIEHVPWMRAAFGPWSVAEVVVPRLPLLATEPEAPRALLHLARELCRDGAAGDTARLQEGLRGALASNPSLPADRFGPVLSYPCKAKRVVPIFRQRH